MMTKLTKTERMLRFFDLANEFKDIDPFDILEVFGLEIWCGALRTRLKPKEVWEEQTNNLVERKYPSACYMDKKSFKKVIPFPEDRSGALLVIPREMLTLDKQCNQIFHISFIYDEKKEWSDYYKISEAPYWIYMVEDGSFFRGVPPEICARELKKRHRRGLTGAEGIALYREYPYLIRSLCLIMTGSCYCYGKSRKNPKFLPRLWWDRGSVCFDYAQSDHPTDLRGYPSCKI